jgi:hypothetical protein
MCYAQELLKITMSSKKTRMKGCRKGSSRSIMSAWNVAAALHKLNGITKNSEVVVGAECFLVDVGDKHPNLVVPGAKMELGEEPGPMQFIEQLIDHRRHP